MHNHHCCSPSSAAKCSRLSIAELQPRLECELLLQKASLNWFKPVASLKVDATGAHSFFHHNETHARLVVLRDLGLSSAAGCGCKHGLESSLVSSCLADGEAKLCEL